MNYSATFLVVKIQNNHGNKFELLTSSEEVNFWIDEIIRGVYDGYDGRLTVDCHFECSSLEGL